MEVQLIPLDHNFFINTYIYTYIHIYIYILYYYYFKLIKKLLERLNNREIVWGEIELFACPIDPLVGLC